MEFRRLADKLLGFLAAGGNRWVCYRAVADWVAIYDMTSAKYRAKELVFYLNYHGFITLRPSARGLQLRITAAGKARLQECRSA